VWISNPPTPAGPAQIWRLATSAGSIKEILRSRSLRRRARAVERFGARRALTDEPLEPVYPATAEAFVDGAIGVEHAAAIADTVEAIPAADRAEHAAVVESTLLEHARVVDPRTVRLLGQRILAHLDPDGPSPAEERLQQAHRATEPEPSP
jgi:MoxR-like ATPase